MWSLRKPAALALAAACAAALAAMALLARENKKVQAAELLAKARQLSDIRAPGSPPFQMQGEFEYFSATGEREAGKYALLWASPDRWREEVSFPGFSQIRVRGKDQIWIYRNVPYKPLEVSRLQYALDSSRVSTLQNGEKLKAVRDRNIDGAHVNCVEVKSRHWSRELCFDAASGLLTLESFPYFTTEFENYAALGPKMFPQNIRSSTHAKPLIDVELSAHVAVVNPGSAAFTPPPHSLEWKTCDHPLSAKPLKTPSPPYPEADRLAKIQGVELAYVLVDVNGNVQHPAILQSLGHEFDVSTLRTLQDKWKFKPSMCGNSPVPSEEVVEVTFRLY